MASAGTAGVAKFGTAAGVSAAGSFKGALGPLVGIAAGLGIGSAIANGIEAGVSALGTAVTAAGSLQQSLGGVKAVFGESATGILDWGKTAATTVGLTRDEYSQLATVLGAQLKNGGTSLDELGTKTNSLIGLGADLASQFGGTTNDAVSALSATLRGEYDSIEKYGVSLTQAAIDAKAAELGFSKLGGTLSTQASQTARLALVYEQTASAQGNFAKESGTLEGAQQRLNASFGDFQAQLGTAMLPAISKLLDVANKDLVPVLGTLADQIGPKLGDALSESTPALIDLARSSVPLIKAFVDLSVAALPGVVAGLQALTPLVTGSLNNWATFASTVSGFFKVLTGDTSVRQFSATVQGMSGNLADAFRWAQSVGTAIGNTARQAGAAVGDFVGLGRNLFQGLINGVNAAASGLLEAVLRPVRNAVSGVKSFLGIHSPSRLMFGIGENTGLGMAKGILSTAGDMERASDVLIPRAPAMASPTVSGGLAAQTAAAVVAGFTGTREIRTDGGTLIGVIREVAGEQAEFEVARADGILARDMERGSRWPR
jgi:hypothetical protein